MLCRRHGRKEHERLMVQAFSCFMCTVITRSYQKHNEHRSANPSLRLHLQARRCILWKNDLKLCLWCQSMAHPPRRDVAAKGARNKGSPHGSIQTHSPSSKRKETLPVHTRIHDKTEGAAQPTGSTQRRDFACLTTCFYATGHVGEFTVKQLDHFDHTKHATLAHLRQEKDRNGLQVTVLHIPVTNQPPKVKMYPGHSKMG